MPDNIGRYEITGELGRGGMSTVLHGYDPRFRRQVAIKLLPREFLHDPRFRARFEREALAVAALEHKGIVPVYDFGEQDGQLYLVMRLMSGGSLAGRLVSGPLSPAAAAEILRQVAPGLDFAHRRGFVHRDLKPANILFDEEGDAYLSDFGIAKMLAGDGESLTGTGGMIGTPAYMSPEQVQALRELDGRSDVYSLGIIYYEMLTGRAPYQADTPMGTAMMHVMQPLPDIRAARSDLPPAAQQIIDRALAKERENRYPTAVSLAAAAGSLASAATSPATEIAATAEMPIVPATSKLPEGAPVAAAASLAPSSPAGTASAGQPSQLLQPTVVDTPPEIPRAPALTGVPQSGSARRAAPPAWLIGVGLLLLCLFAGGLSGVLFRSQLAGLWEQVAGVEPTPTPTRRPASTATRPPAEATATRPAAAIPTESGGDEVGPGVAPEVMPVCEDPLGCVHIGPGEPILLGVMLVFSGPDSQLGQDSLNGVQLAIAERRELHGHPLELMQKDEGCNPEGG
jgi:serine/threonine-protein kinase